MHGKIIVRLRLAALAVLFIATGSRAAEPDARTRIAAAVASAIQPVMHDYQIPGVAVAVTVDGKRYYFNYGVASTQSRRPVTQDTLFELGSVSKIFTATLAGYALASGALSLSEPASRYLPALRGSAFDHVSVLELGTYTAGGLPLQFPDDVTDTRTMIGYFRNWRPAYAPGTQRLYSNASAGLFGLLAANSLNASFVPLLEQTLFPQLGLTHSYIRVPASEMGEYAQGYTKTGEPIRVRPGVLDAQAYGVKSTSADMIRFVEANLNPAGLGLDARLQRAIAATHTGYFRIGDMTQSFGWELYAYPVTLDRLVAGNAPQMSFKANPALRLTPPQRPRSATLLNKTGSTNGFGTYIAFVPSADVGIVLLANKNYPIEARVRAAYAILTVLERESRAKTDQ